MSDLVCPPVTTEEPQRRPSLWSQMIDVITAPVDLFTQLRPLPASMGTGFAVVCLTAFLVVLVNSSLLFSKGAMEDVMRREEKKLNAQVAQGKISAADAATAAERMRGISPILFAVIGAVGGAIATVIVSFCWALVVFLAGKILGGPISFARAYELTGLAFVIQCFAAVVGGGLIMLRDSLTLPTAALFIEDFDPGSKLHNLLQALAPFTIWFVAVLGIGLACSSGLSIRKCLIALLGFWVVKTIILVSAGWGQFA